MGQALEESATVIMTAGGVQSNHCRATALTAARLGLKCHLVLRGAERSPADGNLLLDELTGCRISYASASEFAELDRIFADLSIDYEKNGEKAFTIPVGASDEIGLWGYIEAAAELATDFSRHDIDPGYVISAAGSGGTLGGLILGKHLHGLAGQMVAFNVCDDAAYFKAKISNDVAAWQTRYGQNVPRLPINIIDGYVGPGYGRADEHVYETIRLVASLEGIVLDPVYTGKAFDGFIQELHRGQFKDTDDVVFVHTGGIFGLFPHREQFGNSPTPAA